MFGDRIRQARELSFQTQAELAHKCNIAQSAIAQIESGVYIPSDSVLHAIAYHTGFGIDFLKQEKPPAEFPIGSFLYRTQAKVKPKEKARAHRIAQLMFEIALAMRARLKDIPVLIPKTSEPPEIAAQLMRDALGFSPESPISNLIGAIERAGVMVLSIPIEIPGLDGFSSWVGLNHDIPVICLLQGKKGYRIRFTAAEELGHLVKHHPLRCTVSEADQEARRFAGELLLPEEAMRDEISTPATLSTLWTVRTKYQVSLQFLIRRISDLEIITESQYRYLMMQVSKKGWRREEPGDANVIQEQPKLFSKMVTAIYGNPPDFQRIKKDSGDAPIPFLRNLIEVKPDGPEPKSKVIAFKDRAS